MNNALRDTFDRNKIQPIVIDPRAKDFQKRIERLRSDSPGLQTIDQLADQIKELFLLRHPKHRFQKEYQENFQKWRAAFLGKKEPWQIGRWVYYPWLNYVVHCFDEPLHNELRTARNRFLITEKEQRQFYNARIGILGLSVGSHAALTITLTGGGKFLKMADPDTISGSNLNRIRSPLHTIGINKAVAAARQIAEINPYAEVEIFSDGLTEKNLERFLLQPKLDVLIEEMDNVVLKMRVREAAKKHRLPVIMAADNGDNIVVDVERYDQKPRYPVFHGLLGKMTAADVAKVAPQDFPRLIGTLAAGELNTVRMLQSVMAVGKEIYSWPQLGNAAAMCGAALTYLARKIILGEPVKAGRTDFNIDRLLGNLSASHEQRRQQLLKKLFS